MVSISKTSTSEFKMLADAQRKCAKSILMIQNSFHTHHNGVSCSCGEHMEFVASGFKLRLAWFFSSQERSESILHFHSTVFFPRSLYK